MSDVITEMLVDHVGAIRMPAKLVLRPAAVQEWGRQIGLWGAAICPPSLCPLIRPSSEGGNEMWECEIIILPRRKYSGRLTLKHNGGTGRAFGGMRADQMLVGGYDLPERWGPCYWETSGD